MHVFCTILRVNSGCFIMQHQMVGLCIGDSEGGNEILRKIRMDFSQCEGLCGVVTRVQVCVPALRLVYLYTAHLRQQCHNSKLVIFQEEIFKVLKCYNFLLVQRQHNCSPAASFTNCVMTIYLLKVHLQTFLSIPITQKCQILSCDTLFANGRDIYIYIYTYTGRFIMFSVITNIYNKKTKGPALMELFTATGKLKKFFFTTRDVRCVHHG
jgi:hypothetical protein